MKAASWIDVLPPPQKSPGKTGAFFARPAITGHFFFRRDLS
jgi:hypothetical protein